MSKSLVKGIFVDIALLPLGLMSGQAGAGYRYAPPSQGQRSRRAVAERSYRRRTPIGRLGYHLDLHQLFKQEKLDSVPMPGKVVKLVESVCARKVKANNGSPIWNADMVQ